MKSVNDAMYKQSFVKSFPKRLHTNQTKNFSILLPDVKNISGNVDLNITEQQAVVNYCTRLLTLVNYKGIDIIFKNTPRMRSSGYMDGIVNVQNETNYFSVRFSIWTLNGLSYAAGHSLMKILTRILYVIELKDLPFNELTLARLFAILRIPAKAEQFKKRPFLDEQFVFAVTYDNVNFFIEFEKSSILFPLENTSADSLFEKSFFGNRQSNNPSITIKYFPQNHLALTRRKILLQFPLSKSGIL